MSNINSLLDFYYKKNNTELRDSIKLELDNRQRKLEKLGFKVKRSECMVNYEAAVSLSVEKNNAVLKETRFLQGRRDMSIVIKHDGQETNMPLYPYTFEEAIAVLNAAR